MKGVEFFGLCFICGIVLMAILALILGAVWRVLEKIIRKRLAKRLKAKLQKRYPHLNMDYFMPIFAMRSPCCKKMLWLYDNQFIFNYFCDKCGQRYKKCYDILEEKWTDKLERLPCEYNLSALNELCKNYADGNEKK